jgi:hypothetical protein
MMPIWRSAETSPSKPRTAIFSTNATTAGWIAPSSAGRAGSVTHPDTRVRAHLGWHQYDPLAVLAQRLHRQPRQLRKLPDPHRFSGHLRRRDRTPPARGESTDRRPTAPYRSSTGPRSAPPARVKHGFRAASANCTARSLAGSRRYTVDEFGAGLPGSGCRSCTPSSPPTMDRSRWRANRAGPWRDRHRRVHAAPHGPAARECPPR